VALGGSWIGTARYCRSADRLDDALGVRVDILGFHLLRVLQ
jgi:hypothetical protein